MAPAQSGGFLVVSKERLVGALEHPERQFKKTPAARRETVTPTGADPENPA
jgi:hypothetical protein